MSLSRNQVGRKILFADFNNWSQFQQNTYYVGVDLLIHIFYNIPERWNPQEVSLKEVFRGIQVGLEGAMAEPKTQICGVNSVFDMKGLSFKHIMQFTPSYAKMVLDWIQVWYQN